MKNEERKVADWTKTEIIIIDYANLRMEYLFFLEETPEFLIGYRDVAPEIKECFYKEGKHPQAFKGDEIDVAKRFLYQFILENRGKTFQRIEKYQKSKIPYAPRALAEAEQRFKKLEEVANIIEEGGYPEVIDYAVDNTYYPKELTQKLVFGVE